MSFAFLDRGVHKKDLQQLSKFYEGFKKREYVCDELTMDAFLEVDKLLSKSKYIENNTTDFYKGGVTAFGVVRDYLIIFYGISTDENLKKFLSNFNILVTIAAGKLAKNCLSQSEKN